MGIEFPKSGPKVSVDPGISRQWERGLKDDCGEPLCAEEKLVSCLGPKGVTEGCGGMVGPGEGFMEHRWWGLQVIQAQLSWD